MCIPERTAVFSLTKSTMLMLLVLEECSGMSECFAIVVQCRTLLGEYFLFYLDLMPHVCVRASFALGMVISSLFCCEQFFL